MKRIILTISASWISRRARVETVKFLQYGDLEAHANEYAVIRSAKTADFDRTM